MKTFEESVKSQKTVASMIENKKDDTKSNKKKGKGGMCFFYELNYASIVNLTTSELMS